MPFRLTGVLFSLNYKKVLTAGHLHCSLLYIIDTGMLGAGLTKIHTTVEIVKYSAI